MKTVGAAEAKGNPLYTGTQVNGAYFGVCQISAMRRRSSQHQGPLALREGTTSLKNVHQGATIHATAGTHMAKVVG